MNKNWHFRKKIPNYIKKKIKHILDIDKNNQSSYIFNCCDNTYKLLKVSAKTFADVFFINRKYLFNGDFTASNKRIDYNNSENYLTDDGLAGFAITKNGWLISLFSNKQERGFLHVIKFFTDKFQKLVCLSGEKENKLVSLYKEILDLIPCAETIDDENVMRKYDGEDFVDEFIAFHGKPHHIFMIKKNIKFEKNKVFVDYFSAYKYVDNLTQN